ncbi:RtcB family protein [Rhodococcus antarcticus]|uniref:RtcB family protein n=1 Tax=Rhodococcus antarcticus TaxID=2987751 RepID=UPI003F496603
MSWASILEENTRDQALTTSRLHFVFPHVALMPDAHLGEWVSPKGAIEARQGQLGHIPGSNGHPQLRGVRQGERRVAAVVAARGWTHSRSAASKAFTRAELHQAMVGSSYRDTDAFRDEIPQAYKDIDQVMVDASDLVEVVHTLRQVLNVTGD